MESKKKIQAIEVEITSLLQDDKNANTHTESGDRLLAKSIGELGLGRSVLVDANNKLIAGNGVQRKAVEAGKRKALIVDIDGDTLLVARRSDMNLDDPNDPRARQMALIDNSSALAGIQFDFEIAQEIGQDFGFEVGEWGVEVPEEGWNGEDYGESELPNYSDKNKEIEVDEFEDKCTIVLNYTLAEYEQVKTALHKVAATPEQAVWQLLGLEKNE